MRSLKNSSTTNDTNTETVKPIQSSYNNSNNKQILQQVLELQDEYAAMLSLSGIEVTAESSVAAMRKAYLKLTLQVHPDKHNGSADANSAFQALVNAFDQLSRPPFIEEGNTVSKIMI